VPKCNRAAHTLTVQGAVPRDADFKPHLRADIGGFSLQAAPGQWPDASPGINSPPDCLCPGSALANERVQTNTAGQVVLKLKTPWRDGTTTW
jgi:hypothetical protein